MALIWDGSEYIEDNSSPAPTPSGSSSDAETTTDATTTTASTTSYDPDAYSREVSAANETRRQLNVLPILKAQFEEYGLGSLYPKIVEFVQSGYDGDAIAVLLRNTPEYKARFPAMAKLSAEHRAITEGQYVEYEKTAKAYEVRYGLPSGMVTESVTKLLEGAVSATELNDRVIMSSAASVSAPQDVKDTLKKYYNIDSGGLAAYFLDPQLAMPLLEKQYNSGLIGAEAIRNNIDINSATAEDLQQTGVTTADAQSGFANVAAQKSLTEGKGDTTSQSNLIKSNLKKDVGATQESQRVASSRVGRFQSGGGYSQTSGGVSGLKSSGT